MLIPLCIFNWLFVRTDCIHQIHASGIGASGLGLSQGAGGLLLGVGSWESSFHGRDSAPQWQRPLQWQGKPWSSTKHYQDHSSVYQVCGSAGTSECGLLHSVWVMSFSWLAKALVFKRPGEPASAHLSIFWEGISSAFILGQMLELCVSRAYLCSHFLFFVIMHLFVWVFD